MKPDLLDPIIEVSPPVPPRRLSNDLKDLLAQARGRSLSIGELEEILQGRGFALFILLLALPFSFPIAVPGLSIPFGVVILFVGMRIAMGRKPALPQFILRRRIKYSVLEKIIGFGLKLCSKMEKVVRPRMHFLQRWPGMLNLIGAAIASGGLLLSLPLPPFIPFTNAIPAIAIIFLTAGMIERDGLLVLLGHFVNIAAWIYFIFVAILAEDGIRYLMHFFGAK